MKNIFELTETDKMVDEYKKLKKQIEELEKQTEDLMLVDTNEEITELNKKISLLNSKLAVMPKFSFFTKIIKRKEYLNYKNLSLELENLKKELTKAKETLNENKKTQLKTLEEEIKTFSKRINEIFLIAEKSIRDKTQATIRDFKKQVTYDENGIPIIDDSLPEKFKDEFVDLNFDAETFSLDDIALVHTTDYFPENHVIKTPKDAKVLYRGEYAAPLVINGKDANGNSYSHRNTVHFALNGLVSSHAYGDFSNRKFIIIEPMKYHMDTIHCVRPEDTWTKGSVKLSDDAIILVREDEYNNLSQEMLKEYNVIKFCGDEEKVVEKILLILGYKPQGIGMWNWKNNSRNNGKNDDILYKYIQKNYPEKLQMSHSGSVEAEVEKNLVLRDRLISAIRNENVLTINGLNISYEELIVMMKYMEEYRKQKKSTIIQDFGIRVKENNVYLLDDDSIIESYKSDFDLGIVNEVEKIINLYETIMPYLTMRKKVLSYLLGETFDGTNNIPLTSDMVAKMYQCKNLSHLNIRDFLNNYGIRKLDNLNYQILSDSETIRQYDKIDDEFCKEFEELITNTKSRRWFLYDDDIEEIEYYR